MMTKEENKIKEAFLREIAKKEEHIESLEKDLIDFKEEFLQYRINIKDYIRIDDLKQFSRKYVKIGTVLDSNFKTVYIPMNETVEVDDSGHLYCSSYRGGIVRFDKEQNCYIHCYYGSEEKIDIKYILDIE